MTQIIPQIRRHFNRSLSTNHEEITKSRKKDLYFPHRVESSDRGIIQLQHNMLHTFACACLQACSNIMQRRGPSRRWKTKKTEEAQEHMGFFTLWQCQSFFSAPSFFPSLAAAASFTSLTLALPLLDFMKQKQEQQGHWNKNFIGLLLYFHLPLFCLNKTAPRTQMTSVLVVY